ncbi:glycosyltransferase [Sporichthya sp.]|uniref:glycosyltransferase n=1 Tax=Sporichthya sp. TaxID=65475 RepID=UPI0017DD5164|nr:glycosyltransferase [Sporichthya sp.]MBA3744384.1 glycosyltransferase family 1 protein [Sporichthya sp.]
MTRYLVVTWDGAGNLLPTLGITRALVAAGHDVRLLGHDTIRERCGDAGARFVVLPQPQGWDEMENPDDTEAEIELLLDTLCLSTPIAVAVAGELEREAADVVLVDCMLFSAINVAQAAGLPTAALFHTPYTVFRGGPLVEMFAPGLGRLNVHRVGLGLAPVTSYPELHDSCEVVLAAVPGEFEPGAEDAANVLRIGPVLDGPPLVQNPTHLDVGDGSAPLVLISLSTSEQGQAPLLQRIVDAVGTLPVRAVVTTGPSLDPATVRAAANTQVVSYVPHGELLPSCSAVLTHAGLGTVMAALADGVPMVCVPMGRDQFFNAEMVQVLGAGRMLMPDADTATIAEATLAVLNDASFGVAAKRMAGTIADCSGAAGAVAALEGLAVRR